MPGNIGKITVSLGMRGEDFNISEARPCENRANAAGSHTMHGRIHDLQIARAGHVLRQHLLLVRPIDFLLAIDDLPAS